MAKAIATSNPSEEKNEKKICGIIMPISPHPDYPSDHWKDVYSILIEAVTHTEFTPRLVSEDAPIGLIHDRIVTNIYSNEIVICDVSSKNPNVMFELGLRLAFDKPTIIIKDELTGYSFDTGVIEHIEYPSSLSYKEIVKFKEELKKRIEATYAKSLDDPNFSPFLKSFGKNIVPSKINQKDVTEVNYLVDLFQKMQQELQVSRIEQKELIQKVLSQATYDMAAEGYRMRDLNREKMNLTMELQNLKQINAHLNSQIEEFKNRLHIEE